jgi:16S rRNA (guanine966-N2)-methyltransferase
LDLFAGSGALGFEAMSRGASTSLFVEQDLKAVVRLRANAALLKADNAVIVSGDALSFLQQGNTQAPYHIVFIDPPFQLQLWQQVIEALEHQNWLADDATIYIESSRDLSYHVPPNWQMHRDKITGQVRYRLFYREK